MYNSLCVPRYIDDEVTRTICYGLDSIYANYRHG